MRFSLIAIAAILLLAILAVSQAAPSNSKLSKKLVQKKVDLSKISDPKVKKVLGKWNNAIHKAKNAKTIVASLKKKYINKNTTEEVASDSSNGVLSMDQLKAIMPNLSNSKANDYISHINDALSWGSITTCSRMSSFLAQLAHESAELRYMEEIASGAAYEGRKNLGNIYPGDGTRYKGRGPIQLTGRANYRTAGADLGVDLEENPTLAATPQWGFKIAAWYWKTRSLNQYADQNTQASFDIITKKINGGYNGKADRDKFWNRAKGVLGC